MRLINPTNPLPPLIGDGTPAVLYALICSNDESAEGPLPFRNTLAGGIYKFLERVRTFALGLDCKNEYH